MEESTSASGSESVELNNSLQSDCCSASDDSVQRFVNSFRATKLSYLTRKRAACRNAHISATTPAKRKSKPSCSTEPKSVRLKEYFVLR